ncbi:MAG TPA: Ig-like domain-containing protein [Thermoanaerobaculia bacterium]|nr:Ig-like domain-containing protein [Thermoanaerobaculia bacterium]
MTPIGQIGTISINVPKSQVGNPQLHDILGGIYARTFEGSGTQSLRSSFAVDNTTQPTGSLSVTTTYGSYGIVGSCAANSPPIAVDDVATVRENGSLEVNVLANDSDPDGDALKVTIFQAPAHGTAARTGDQQVSQPDRSACRRRYSRHDHRRGRAGQRLRPRLQRSRAGRTQ